MLIPNHWSMMSNYFVGFNFPIQVPLYLDPEVPGLINFDEALNIEDFRLSQKITRVGNLNFPPVAEFGGQGKLSNKMGFSSVRNPSLSRAYRFWCHAFFDIHF